MNARHQAVILSALAVLAVPVTSVDAAHGTDHRNDVPAGTITGIDGEVYPHAPEVVRGLGDELYFGPELDYACQLGGERLSRSIEKMAKLAGLLERSGRTVVYTVAPGKSWSLGGRLDDATLPHGSCDRAGLAQQNAVLDTKRPSYLPMRRPLSSKRRQMYWKTDPHWTTVGASTFARRLASRLDPRLGQRQRYDYSTESLWGNLAEALGDPTVEVGEHATPAGGVTSRTSRGGADWAGYPAMTYDHSWTSGPRRRTWPGHTVLMGDSFMWYALENLRPVFRHGRFIWIGKVPVDEVLDSIVRADTVVFEAYAAFGSPFAAPLFRRAVKQALDGAR